MLGSPELVTKVRISWILFGSFQPLSSSSTIRQVSAVDVIVCKHLLLIWYTQCTTLMCKLWSEEKYEISKSRLNRMYTGATKRKSTYAIAKFPAPVNRKVTFHNVQNQCGFLTFFGTVYTYSVPPAILFTDSESTRRNLGSTAGRRVPTLSAHCCLVPANFLANFHSYPPCIDYLST